MPGEVPTRVGPTQAHDATDLKRTREYYRKLGAESRAKKQMHHQLNLLERRVSEAPPLQHREDPAMV